MYELTHALWVALLTLLGLSHRTIHSACEMFDMNGVVMMMTKTILRGDKCTESWRAVCHGGYLWHGDPIAIETRRSKSANTLICTWNWCSYHTLRHATITRNSKLDSRVRGSDNKQKVRLWLLSTTHACFFLNWAITPYTSHTIDWPKR